MEEVEAAEGEAVAVFEAASVVTMLSVPWIKGGEARVSESASDTVCPDLREKEQT